MKKELLFFDGAMGTALQEKGLKLDEMPELYNFTHPEVVKEIHKGYLDVGSDFITTNTFGCNSYRIKQIPYTVEETIRKGVALAKEAIQGFANRSIALDIGPTGERMKPVGDVTFKELYNAFKEQALLGETLKVDAIVLETFMDLEELRAAVMAVKENTKLPVFATMSFEPNGYTFFGTSLEDMVVMLECADVDALGVNCSLGPEKMLPVIERLVEISSIPLIVQLNAGMPIIENGNITYSIKASEFARSMRKVSKLGVNILGGCCGTNQYYIQEMINCVKN